LLHHLPNAAFIAIDEEMTGINVRAGGGQNNSRPTRDLTPSQRYHELKLAPERYNIIQFGIALFFRNHPTASENDTGKNHSARGYSTTSSGNSMVPPSSPVRTSRSSNNASSTGSNELKPPSSSTTIPHDYLVRRYNFYMFPSAPGNNNSYCDSGYDQKDVVLNPSTISFLHQHNMSLDMWSRDGIPYATTDHATTILGSYRKKELDIVRERKDPAQNRPVTVQDTIRNRVELTRIDDKNFHARAMANLREWLDSPISATTQHQPAEILDPNDDEGVITDQQQDPLVNCSFLLPPCNSFLRRALYESIQKEYPALELESGGNQQIRVWRLNEMEKVERNRRLRKESWEELIGKRLGVWRIFEALRRACSGLELDPSSILFANSYEQVDWDRVAGFNQELNETPSRRPIPIVVHNGFMDLCFLMTHFVSHQLPDKYGDCKLVITEHFPLIYDTKVLATECPCWDSDSNEQNASTTNLANLFQIVVCDPNYYYNRSEENSRALLDDIYVLPAVGRSNKGNVEDQEHEAAYDAYMTGAIFVGLCHRIDQRIPTSAPNCNFLNIIHSQEHHNTARICFGRNKLYQMSIYTMDLEEMRPDRDPLNRGMLSESTYRISGIDKAVSTRDIVQCLSGIRDSADRQVNFVIVWIDDTTFLVAATYRPTYPPVHHGDVVVDAIDGVLEEPIQEIDTSSNDETETILQEHGNLLLPALQVRFNKNETIVVLEDYLASLANSGIVDNAKDEAQNFSWVNRIWSMFGGATNKKRTSDETMESSSKRRRIN
jgi:CAF1 family ribonuclease